MRTFLFVLWFAAASALSQTNSLFDCGLPSGTGGISTRTGTIKAVLFYCVNLGEQDTLPEYFPAIKTKTEDYFEKASFGQFHVQIVDVLSRDSVRAFMGTIPFNSGNACFSPPYCCTQGFIFDVFGQADLLYDFGKYDNDGPDGIANSGDDDGYVDFMFFWFLNYSSRAVAGMYDMCADFVTTDSSFGPGRTFRGFVKISPSIPHATENRKDPRDVIYNADEYAGVNAHEGGHSLLNFPDMDHEGNYRYDHFALGSYEAMSTAGFDGVPSLYNPWFRERRGWTTVRSVVSDMRDTILTPFDETGVIYKYSPASIPPGAASVNDFIVSFHKNNQQNYWTTKWPLGSNGGLMIWHMNKTQVELYDAYLYSDRRKMPIDIEAAHGKYDWVDSLNTGVQNPLTGLDSIEIRIGSWYPYKYSSSNGVGSRSVAFEPNSGKNFTFYSNPTSNFYHSSAPYARAVTSGFAVKNVVTENGSVRLDVLVEDTLVTENATLGPGTWYITKRISVPQSIAMEIAGTAILNFQNNSVLTVNGTLQLNSGSNVTFDGGYTTVVVDSGVLAISNAALSLGQNTKVVIGSSGTLEWNSGASLLCASGASIEVYGTVKVPSSVAMTLPSSAAIVAHAGARFILADDAQIVVRGSLTATGGWQTPVTFSKDEGASTWSGIIADGTVAGSSLWLEHATISDVVGTAVTVGNTVSFAMLDCSVDGVDLEYGVQVLPGEAGQQSTMQLYNNTFNNCNTGIYLYNSSNVNLVQNTVNGIDGEGIVCVSSSPIVIRNVIENCQVGVYCSEPGSPMFESYQDGGNNVIHGNATGVKIDAGSEPILGSIGPIGTDVGGQNSIYENSDWNVFLDEDYATVLAENNWWGTPDDPSKTFYIKQTSELIFDPWLMEDPNPLNKALKGGYAKGGLSGGSPLNGLLTLPEEMRLALKERRHNSFDRAAEVLKGIISNNSMPHAVKRWALGQLQAIGQRMSQPNLSTFLGSLGTSQAPLARTIKGLLPFAYWSERSASQALTAFASNIQHYPHSDLARAGLYGKFIHCLYVANDTTEARRLLRLIKAESDSSCEYKMALSQMKAYRRNPSHSANSPGISDEPKAKLSEAESVTELFENYPNPFNPATSIRFSLKEAGNVSLKVYDILGREVAVLVNDELGAGKHEALFDATSMASGTYFYRLQAGIQTEVKRMLLLR